MWIDTLPMVFGALATILTLIGGMAAAVRWVVRREMQPIRGEVHALSDRFDVWIAEHQRQHDDVRAAIASAFEREGMNPPDGWGRRVPHGTEGQQQ